MNPRYLAVQILTPLFNDSSSLKHSLNTHIKRCPDNQRPILQELCYGSMRHYPALLAIISTLLKKPLKKKDNDIMALLLIGVHQLRNMNVADHAAISETVDVCKTLKKPWATALINAALRTYQRDALSITSKLEEQESFKFNHPQWFVDKLKHNWPDHWTSILSANDQHPPLTIRVDTKRVSRETFKQQLEQEGINSSNTTHSEYGLTFEKPTDITAIQGFDDGLFSVQDEAAQLAANIVSPSEGENILDACSAPGGKLLHLLELTRNKNIRIQGLELEPKRAEKIKENFKRLNLDCELHIADATTSNWWDKNSFDKILLDAPCSATGVIRRNPDIKLLRKAEQIHSIAKLQKEILHNLWSMLAVNGELIYATCSIFPQENERIIASFLKENDDARHCEIDSAWGERREFGRQLFPTNGAHDGFYYAKLTKISL